LRVSDNLFGTLFDKGKEMLGIRDEAKPNLESPSSSEQLVQDLQNVMLTTIEKALPRMDVDLPPGFQMGVYEQYTPLSWGLQDLTDEEIENADRELAAAYAMMFAGLGNSGNLVLLFRNGKLANLAKQEFAGLVKESGLRIAAFPGSKALGDPVEALQKAIDRRGYIIVVAPRERQLALLKALEDRQQSELDKMASDKLAMLVILLNARLREGGKQLGASRSHWADASNPIFHASLVGPKAEAILYHQCWQEWILSARPAVGATEAPKVLARWESQPSEEELETALSREASSSWGNR